MTTTNTKQKRRTTIVRNPLVESWLATLPRPICQECGEELAWTQADRDVAEQDGPLALVDALKERNFRCTICADYTPRQHRY